MFYFVFCELFLQIIPSINHHFETDDENRVMSIQAAGVNDYDETVITVMPKCFVQRGTENGRILDYPEGDLVELNRNISSRLVMNELRHIVSH